MKKALCKAILASAVTVLGGWFFAAVGHDMMNGFNELGTIAAVAIMGAWILFFGELKKK